MPSNHSSDSRSSGRQCWICFATEEDDPNQTWTKPCKCKGTTKWVHQRCLLMWIDLKAKAGKSEKILCPQCKMEYTIYYPPSNLLVNLLDIKDSAIFRCCPFMAGAIMMLLVYWSSISYGVIVMIQVLGPEATRQQLETTSPAVLLVALPSLPIMLLGFSFFQWEERLLLCLRKFGPRVPVLRHILPAPVINPLGPMMIPPIGEEMTCTRLIVTSLLTPGLAAIVGNLLFKKSVENPIKRAFFGFLVMNLAHGIVVMYHKQMIYKKYKGRRVMDYAQNDEPQRPPVVQNVLPSSS